MVPAISEKENVQKHMYHITTNDPPVTLPSEKTFEKDECNVTFNRPFLSRLSCLATPFRALKIEMVSFLFTFSQVLTKISSSAMILDKVCIAHFRYSAEICDNLENYTDIKISVERMSTNYQLGHTLIQITPAAIVSCFIGPWSDSYGRKIPIVIAIAGVTLDTLGSTVCAYYLDSRVEYYYIPAIFYGMSGGNVSLIAVVYSYASDMTPFEKRTLKYAYIEMASCFALPLGMAVGGWTFEFLGYPAVFILSTAGLFCSLMWVIVLLPETRGLDKKDSWETKIKILFTCSSVRDSFMATTKKRPHKGRTQIILLIMSMCFLVIATTSTTDINFLYVHHRYDWGDTKYSNFTAIYSIFSIVVLLTLLPIFKHLKVRDPTLGLIGTTSNFLKFVVIGAAYKPNIFHLGNILGILSLCATLAGRSRISKVVSNDDLGKVFSFVATAESFFPVIATVIVSEIFNAFLPIFPGAPYILLSLSLILPFAVFSWLWMLPVLSKEDMQESTIDKPDIQNTDT